MDPGVGSLVPDPRFREEIDRAAALVREHPGRWRILYHYDGDGIASASALLRALARLGYPAQATAFFGVERERMAELLRATNGPVLIADTGSSWLDLYAGHRHPVVVLDHHRYPPPARPPPETVALVNPLDWGVDGMDELCGATLSWLFTIALDGRNWDNAPWGISGAIADRQHMGGFRGLNARLMEEACRRSLLATGPGLAVRGSTLVEALAEGIDPFVRGISGHPEAARSLLSSLGLDPARPPSSLAPEEAARLAAELGRRLQEAGVLPEYIGVLTQPRWTALSLGRDAEELSNLQNACGRAGEPGVGVALALGDAASLRRAESLERAWRRGILDGLLRLESGEVHSMPALQWFESPEPTLAGTQAGLAMIYLLDPERPVVALSSRPGEPIKASGRGTSRLVARGLDLAAACRVAAAEVGGEGGGHRIASGATVPADRREAFLAALHREIAGQLAAASGAPGGARA
ncbi:MAG: DHH family phosphoesterase [Thermoplasmata archaeon]